MARHKAGNAGFTDKAHLKAKGLIPRSDGTKKVSPKYEETCPKCEGEECQCPTTMEITNADKMINTTAYQNYKSGDEHYHPAEDLEEQKRQLEEEIAFLSEMRDTMIQEKIQQGFAVRFFDPSNGKRFAAAYPNKKDAQDKAAQLKKDGLKDISITQHTLNFKEESIQEARYEVEGTTGYRGISGEDNFYMVINANSEKDAEDKAYDALEKARKQRKIGPGGGGNLEDTEVGLIQKTNDKLSAPETFRGGN
jgi:hypothetical protein